MKRVVTAISMCARGLVDAEDIARLAPGGGLSSARCTREPPFSSVTRSPSFPRARSAHDFVIVLVACVFGALRAVFFTSRARVVAAHVALALRFFAQAPTAFRAVATFRARAAIGRVTARVIVARIVLFARVVIARVARRAGVAVALARARVSSRSSGRRPTAAA